MSEKYWWPRPPAGSTEMGDDQAWPLFVERITYTTDRPTNPELAPAEL